jgi:prepilin-type N-terminal cleavage/methylation domain-containing protein
MPRSLRSLKGFTLVELLVVIAIIGVLVALLMPAIQAARESARKTGCQNNLKQMGVGLLNYHGARKAFPPGYQASQPYSDGATDTDSGWGWGTLILPFMEDNKLYKAIHLDLPVADPKNAKPIAVVLSAYLCPSDVLPEGNPPTFSVPDAFGKAVATAAPSSYAACVGGDESAPDEDTGLGVFYRNSHIRIADITDGTSKTILIGERGWANANGIWAGAINNGVCLRGKLNRCPIGGAASYPASVLVQAHSHLNNATSDTDGGLDDFSSRHSDGSFFLFGDGAAHFIRDVPGDAPGGAYTADSIVFQALGTRAGQEMIPSGWIAR